MTVDLFQPEGEVEYRQKRLGPGAVVLRGFAAADATTLMAALQDVMAAAPFRHMITPGGFRMSVAMTNCGSLGWVTDKTGYRYDPVDPDSGRNWPQMPDSFSRLATDAAAHAGFSPGGVLGSVFGRIGQGRQRLQLMVPFAALSFSEARPHVAFVNPPVTLASPQDQGADERLLLALHEAEHVEGLDPRHLDLDPM